MPDLGGDITLQAHIDGSGLPAELRRDAERASRGVKIEIPTDINEKGLAAKVEATAKSLSHFAEIEFQADLDTKRLRAEAEALKHTLGGSINIGNAPTELRSMWTKANREAAKFKKATEARIEATVDFKKATEELAAFKARRAFMEKPIEIPVELDPRGAVLAKMRALWARLNEQDDILLHIDIQEEFDSERLRGVVKRNMQKKLDELRQEHLTIRADIDADLKPLQAKLAAMTRDRKIEAKIAADVDKASVAKANAELRALVDEDITVKMHLRADPNLISVRLAEDAMRAAISERPIKIPVKMEVDNASVIKTALNIAALRALLTDLGKGFGNVFKGFRGLPILAATVSVFRFFAATVVLITVAIAAALPYLQALGVELAFVALQLLAAASAAAAFVAGGIVAIGAAALTAVVGVHGLAAAFTALNKLWANQAAGVKSTKKELKAYKEALNALSPSARDFVTTLDEMHPALRKVQQAVQETLFKGLGDQLSLTARSVLPTLKKGLEGIAIVLNDIALKTLAWLGSDEGVAKMNALFGISERTLRQLSTALGNFALGFLTLFLGSDDNINSLGESLVSLSRRFKTWADQVTKDGSWQKWLADGRAVLGDLGGIIGGIKDIAIGFWNAIMGDDAKNLPDVIHNIRTQFEKWGTWMKNPENQKKIKDFLDKMTTDLWELWAAAVAVAEAILAIRDAIEKAIEKWKEWDKWLRDHGMTPGLTPNKDKNAGAPVIQPEVKEDAWRRLKHWLDWWRQNLGPGSNPIGPGGTITLNPVLGPVPPTPQLDPIPWPIDPVLGPLPPLPSLPPIPWPIAPRLGRLPSLPTLPPIPWPINPVFGPLPPLPILVPGLWPIVSRYLPLPPFPTLPNPLVKIRSVYLPLPPFPALPHPLVRIRSVYLPLPPFPKLPSPVVKVRIQYTGGGPVPGSAEYCRAHPNDPICFARGGIVNGAQMAIVGESGPEAIVPLNRTQPLDPGVRALLHSIAADRGMTPQPTAKQKDTITPNINVTLPTGDPEAAAMSVWNRLVFEGVV